MQSFQSSTWSDVDGLRARCQERESGCLADAAQAFAKDLAMSSPTVVLARVFLLLPMSRLSSADQDFARTFVGGLAGLHPNTPVLTLLGTHGRQAAWRDRKQSVGHRAIPLLGSEFVGSIPMISKLLADLEVNVAGLDNGTTIATRRMLGGRNAAFYVEDARSSLDSSGRVIIPSRDFVETNGVRTVFGMGGAYFDGTLVTAIVFTNESVDRIIVDRFPSLISNFKMSTSKIFVRGTIYGDSAAG